MSKFDELIETARASLAQRQAELDWLLSHRAQLEPIGLESIDLLGYSVDINRPSREQALAVIQALGGQWAKEVSYDETQLNYRAKIDGQHVRLYCAPPPPSCRLVEKEIELPAEPARIVKRFVLECTPQEP